jgi:hypothetical protein
MQKHPDICVVWFSKTEGTIFVKISGLWLRCSCSCSCVFLSNTNQIKLLPVSMNNCTKFFDPVPGNLSRSFEIEFFLVGPREISIGLKKSWRKLPLCDQQFSTFSHLRIQHCQSAKLPVFHPPCGCPIIGPFRLAH